MLALLFYLKDTMYTISCKKIKEIIPMMTLKIIPNSPEFFTGFFNYRGKIVPVIDLCRLIQGSPCKMRLSTRIIIVDYKGIKTNSYLLGIIAERVTETMIKSDKNYISSSVTLENMPYLNGIIMDNNQIIQCIDTDLLPDCIDFFPSERKDL